MGLIYMLATRMKPKTVLYSLCFIIIFDICWSVDLGVSATNIFYAFNIIFGLCVSCLFCIRMINEKCHYFKYILRIFCLIANVFIYGFVYHNVTPPGVINFAIIIICFPLIIPFIIDVCKIESVDK